MQTNAFTFSNSEMWLIRPETALNNPNESYFTFYPSGEFEWSSMNVLCEKKSKANGYHIKIGTAEGVSMDISPGKFKCRIIYFSTSSNYPISRNARRIFCHQSRQLRISFHGPKWNRKSKTIKNGRYPLT